MSGGERKATPRRNTDHVIEAIDNALRDAGMSNDAMRWAPDGQAEDAPVFATGGVVLRADRDYSMGEMVRWPRADPVAPQSCEQRRADCTVEEFQAWMDEGTQLTWDAEMPFTDFSQPLVTISQRFPPCLGCGHPVYGRLRRDAFTVTESGHGDRAVTFHPCGCTLVVRNPVILDHIPEGTYLERGVRLVLSGEMLQTARDRNGVLDRARAKLAHALGQRPQVVLLLNQAEAGGQASPGMREAMGPDDRMMVGGILRAIPGGTSHIVIRPGPGLPDGFMSSAQNGRCMERAVVGPGPLIRVGVRGGTALARETGRVEIRNDGAVAEVYEVIATDRL